MVKVSSGEPNLKYYQYTSALGVVMTYSRVSRRTTGPSYLAFFVQSVHLADLRNRFWTEDTFKCLSYIVISSAAYTVSERS